MNTKLHAVTDANDRPIRVFMTAGRVSDYTGAAALLDELPKAQWLLADRGYDADRFRDALQDKGITPCIPGRKSRNKAVKTASAATNGATAPRSCSAASRTGDRLVWRHAGGRFWHAQPLTPWQLKGEFWSTAVAIAAGPHPAIENRRVNGGKGSTAGRQQSAIADNAVSKATSCQRTFRDFCVQMAQLAAVLCELPVAGWFIDSPYSRALRKER